MVKDNEPKVKSYGTILYDGGRRRARRLESRDEIQIQWGDRWLTAGPLSRPFYEEDYDNTATADDRALEP